MSQVRILSATRRKSPENRIGVARWRASKLVGVSVIGNDQKKIGTIEDVLFDHDGNAQVIVVGVGGFLGIGEKNVGVPFK
jgi:sporulation protein YlmC with PRC-barrel domain